MSFSDWIVLVSILFGVVLAVFKYDEWEIIKLKKGLQFIWLPIIFLFLSGIASYFHSNPHPDLIDNLLWTERGLRSGLWALVWIIIFFGAVRFQWKKFTNQEPSLELVEKYKDYFETYEPARFSSLFRKYERYFFNSNDDISWKFYELLLTNEKWWAFAPSFFKEMFRRHPDRFYEMNTEVLKSLLTSQLAKIPNSQITQELEEQWNGVRLNESTPILNIFLSTSNFIKESSERNFVWESVKENAEEYFSSIKFLNTDRPSFLIAPSDNAYKQVAPRSLTPFYFIEFVNCYWNRVISEKIKVFITSIYLNWTPKLLEVAPEIKCELPIRYSPNLYVCAVDKMLSNINEWVKKIISDEILVFELNANDLAELKRNILIEIQGKFRKKVSKKWLIIQTVIFFEELILCKNFFEEKFEPNLEEYILKTQFKDEAFDKLTDEKFFREKYPSESRAKNLGYEWLKGIIEDE